MKKLKFDLTRNYKFNELFAFLIYNRQIYFLKLLNNLITKRKFEKRRNLIGTIPSNL